MLFSHACVTFDIYVYLFDRCKVATISWLPVNIDLFSKRALSKRLYSSKETYILKEPTNHIHPICMSHLTVLTSMSAPVPTVNSKSIKNPVNRNQTINEFVLKDNLKVAGWNLVYYVSSDLFWPACLHRYCETRKCSFVGLFDRVFLKGSFHVLLTYIDVSHV